VGLFHYFNLSAQMARLRMMYSAVYCSEQLVRERYKILQGHMFSLYAGLIMNSFFMALAVAGNSSVIAAYSVPILLANLTVFRLRFWRNKSENPDTMPIEYIHKKLRTSNFFALILASILAVWAIGISRYLPIVDRTFVALFAMMECMVCAISPPLTENEATDFLKNRQRHIAAA
jgi:predicted signal transduction protein with EAL and GGDEF domain